MECFYCQCRSQMEYSNAGVSGRGFRVDTYGAISLLHGYDASQPLCRLASSLSSLSRFLIPPFCFLFFLFVCFVACTLYTSVYRYSRG